MTQGDLLPYPLAIRPCHVIYGQPLIDRYGRYLKQSVSGVCFVSKAPIMTPTLEIYPVWSVNTAHTPSLATPQYMSDQSEASVVRI